MLELPEIRTIAAQAAETVRLPKEAIEIWRQVLKIIPRHAVATERVRKLESGMKNFRKSWKKATILDFRNLFAN